MSRSIAALTKPELSFMCDSLEGSDQFLTVQEILLMGDATTDRAIRAEVERFYVAAKESLQAIWPVVRSVARALLKHTELDYSMFLDAVGARDIYAPVFAVQETHGLWQPGGERP